MVVVVTGADEREARSLLRIPKLGPKVWGWRCSSRAAAQLRVVGLQSAAHKAMLDVEIRIVDEVDTRPE